MGLFGTVWAWWIHDQNSNFLQQGQKDKTHQGMVQTADDASYIIPAQNFEKYGVWKDGSTGLSSYMQRPPGMGLINLVLIKIFKEDFFGAHQWIALVFHFFALVAFACTVSRVMFFRITVLLQALYALVPCFWGYLSYHLTESITPSILVFLMYGYVRYDIHKKAGWLMYQSLIVSILLLVRPQLALFILPFIYFLIGFIRKFSVSKFVFAFAAFSIAFAGVSIWQVRNATIANILHAEKWAGIHPIYSVTNASQYRPIHRSLGELFKIWEHNSATFHGITTLLFTKALSNDEIDSTFTRRLVHELNFRNCKGLEEETLFQLFFRYQEALHESRNEYILNRPFSGETRAEEKARKDIDQLASKLKRQNIFLCYVKTPFRSAVFMFTKSQLNLKIFQIKYRGYWWMEGLRYFCIVMILSISLLSLAYIFKPKEQLYFLLAISFLLYLFYLFFIQKMNEERYLMPLLPILLITGTRFVYKIYEKNRTV